MTPDEAAFLQAIADNPADETARLVYADFLAERDDPKAAFARLSADFLRCVRELSGWERELQTGWARAVNPLSNLRLVFMSWQHDDGDTAVWQAHAVAGRRVVTGELLFALESDRMNFELRAEEPGVIVSVLATEGDRVAFGRPMLAYLRTPSGE